MKTNKYRMYKIITGAVAFIIMILAAVANCQAQSPEPKTITIPLSKGEQFTEKEWQEYSKQMLPHVKMYFKRDSSHQKFISNTASPYLMAGDTVQNFKITDKEILLILKPKKK